MLFQPKLQDSQKDTYVFRYEKTKLEFIYCRNCHPLIITQVRSLMNASLFLVTLIFDIFHLKKFWLLHLGVLTNITSQLYFTIVILSYYLLDIHDMENLSNSRILYIAQLLLTIVYPISWSALMDVVLYPTHVYGEMEIVVLTVVILTIEIFMTLHYIQYSHVVYPLVILGSYLLVIGLLNCIWELPIFSWAHTNIQSYTTHSITLLFIVGVVHVITTFICKKKYVWFTDPNQSYPGYTRIIPQNVQA